MATDDARPVTPGELVFRAGLTRLAGRILGYPDREALAEIHDLAEKVRTLTGDESWQARLDNVAEQAAAASSDELEGEYLALTEGNGRASLAEGSYAPGVGAALELRLADLSGYYAAFGMERDPGAPRPDHASVELEFYSELLLRTAYGIETGDAEQEAICSDAARNFLAQHLGGWLPLAAERLGQQAESGHLVGAAGLARTALVAEMKTFGVSPAWRPAEKPRDVAEEGPPDCAGCPSPVAEPIASPVR